MKIGASPPPPPVPPGGGHNGNSGPKKPDDPVVTTTPIDRVTISDEAREALEVYKRKVAIDLEATERLMDKSEKKRPGDDLDIEVGDVKFEAKAPQIENRLFRWIFNFFVKKAVKKL